MVGLMQPKIVIVHYSSTGNLYHLAKAMEAGANEAGAAVRLRRVAELASPEAIAYNPKWVEHAAFAEANVALAELDDLAWADGIALGTPTRFGGPAAQLKQFLDQTGGLWAKGQLADKVVTAFTSASTTHGGLESTILATLNAAYHWGSIILPVGYTHEAFTARGNPYGASHVAVKGSEPDEIALAAAHQQGRRLTTVAGWTAAGRAGSQSRSAAESGSGSA